MSKALPPKPPLTPENAEQRLQTAEQHRMPLVGHGKFHPRKGHLTPALSPGGGEGGEPLPLPPVSTISEECLGRLAYETYCQARQWKGFEGQALPQWGAVRTDIKVAWMKVAWAVKAASAVPVERMGNIQHSTFNIQRRNRKTRKK